MNNQNILKRKKSMHFSKLIDLYTQDLYIPLCVYIFFNFSIRGDHMYIFKLNKLECGMEKGKKDPVGLELEVLI